MKYLLYIFLLTGFILCLSAEDMDELETAFLMHKFGSVGATEPWVFANNIGSESEIFLVDYPEEYADMIFSSLELKDGVSTRPTYIPIDQMNMKRGLIFYISKFEVVDENNVTVRYNFVFPENEGQYEIGASGHYFAELVEGVWGFSDRHEYPPREEDHFVPKMMKVDARTEQDGEPKP